MTKQMALAVLVDGNGAHPASWLHPDVTPGQRMDIRHMAKLAQQAEAEKYDLFFIADTPATRTEDLDVWSRYPMFTDGLEPWDLTQLEPYQPEFLAGFSAEGYQVDLDEGFVEARAIMDRQIRRDVKFDIGGDRQRVHRVDTQVSDVTFKHILLPVWMAAYRYRGESYRFVVNGTTGRVQGERPWSAWKIGFAVLLGLIVAGAVGYVVAMNQGM